LTLTANQEEAMALFFGGKNTDALQVAVEILEQENITKIEEIQALILKSQIHTEMGEQQQGLQASIRATLRCNDIAHPLLIIDSLFAQVTALFNLGEVDKSIKALNEAKLVLSKSRGVETSEKKRRKALNQFYTGRVLRKQGELKRAIKDLEKSLPVMEEIGYPYEYASILNELGIIHGMKGDYDAALNYSKKSLSIFEELKNSLFIVKILNNIGQTLWQKGDLDKALENYLRAQELSEQIGRKLISAVLLLNIGLISNDRGELDSALNYFNKSLLVFKELKRDNEAAICYNNLGRIFQVKGELDLALKHYKQSLSIFETIGNKHEIAACDNNIGMVYQLKGDYMEAAAYLAKTLVIQEEIGNPRDIAKTLQNLIENYIHAGAKESAEHYLSQLKETSEIGQNKIIEQEYKLCLALVLKMSGRVVQRAEAQNILTEIANSEILNHEVTVDAMLNLFELLLFELRTTGNQDVLAEVKDLSQKLLSIAKSQESFARLAEVYHLQSKLALLELDVKQSQYLLTQAQLIAETKGLYRLAQSISNEFDSLLNDLSKWDDYIDRNASISERYELAELENMMGAILRKRESSYDDLPGEDPIMVLILDEAGLCLYSSTFTTEATTLQDQLIGGLLTSINAFMREAFSISGSIERIKHQNNTLLLKNVGPYLFSYVFQGQSYSAIQKLDKFIENLQSSPLWDDITKIRSTGRTDAVRNALDEAASLAFVQ
jgi:tetratricopeptide (TPR) repeat protein